MAAPEPHRLEGVLFDLDDTLMPWQTVAHWQWAWKPLGPVLSERHTLSTIRRALHTWDRRQWEALVGGTPPPDASAYRTFLASTLDGIAGRTLPTSETDAVVQRFLRPTGEVETFADVTPTLTQLRALGRTIGVQTSLPEETAVHLLKRAGLADLRLVLTGSGDEPRLPLPAAFRRAAAALDLPPKAILLVGDQFWSDIRAGGRAGFSTAFVDRRGWAPRVQARRVTRLPEIIDLLVPETVPPPPETGDAGPSPP